MQNVFKNQKPIVIAAVLAAAVTAVAWQNKNEQPAKNSTDTFTIAAGDTVEPRKRISDKNEFRLDDLDNVMKDLDRDMKRLNQELKSLNLENIDKQIRASMAAVDFEKMNKELQASMSKIEMTKMHADVEKAMKAAEASMKKIDLTRVTEEMKVLQNKLNSEEFKMKFDGEKLRKTVEEGMEKAKEGMERAKEGMEKARVEMKNFTDFMNELEKDGLINKNSGYKVQLKDGVLFINGKEQSKETTTKYNKYYKEKKNFSISVNGDTIINL